MCENASPAAGPFRVAIRLLPEGSPPQASVLRGGFMQAGPRQFSILERFAVVTILLLAFAILVERVLHSVRESEKRSLNHAAVESLAAKNR
jgi:hypothetical protein